MVTSELTYNLSGTIRHLGLPVSGVFVVLHESGYGSTAASRTLLSEQRTGPRGEFNFAVGAGSYCLEIVPDGSTRFVRQLIGGIEVSANTIFNVSLTTGLILEGMVCTAGSGIIQNCSLTALGIEPSGFRAVTLVDDSGRYSTVLPKGKYYLIPSWKKSDSSQGGTTSQVPFLTTFVEVVELDQDHRHDVILPDLTHLKALVTDKTGNPVPSTNVSIASSVARDNPLYPEISCIVRAVSDQSGTFELNVQPGDYDIVLTPPASSQLCEMSFRSMALGKESTHRIELMEGVRLRGKVSFQGGLVAGCSVKIRSKDGKLAYAGMTDENGRFSFGLPAGSYEVSVFPYQRRRRHSVEAPWCRSVVVGGGETRVDVDLGVAVPVVGHVKDPKGRNRGSVTVSACPDRGGQPESEDLSNPLASWTTDDSGRFKLMLAAGKYWIFIAGNPSTAQQVEVTTQLTNLDFTWQGSVRARFEVVGDEGDPIARCKVSWRPYGKEQQVSAAGDKSAGKQAPSAAGSAFTGDDGCCELVLSAGIYSFHFEPLPHGHYGSKEIRQLSVGADIARKIKLPVKVESGDAQLLLDFSPNAGTD